jgi:hypothetical protein
MTIPDNLAKKWNKAFEELGTKVPIGDHVVCDVCSQDWTKRPESGGFLFGSYSYCPNCAGRGLKEIKRCDEERFIHAFCPEGESFADFVRRMRGPDSYIRVSKLNWPPP